jgi:hypothetical protein
MFLHKLATACKKEGQIRQKVYISVLFVHHVFGTDPDRNRTLEETPRS